MISRRQAPLALVAIAVACAACAPSLATMQPAHVAPKGHFQFTSALEVGIPTGGLATAIDAGKTLSDAARSGNLTADQERRVFEAGVNVLASPPSVGPNLMLAYTPLDRFEVGIRYAGSGWRLGARYQLLRHEEAPLDLTVGAGVARSAYAIPLGDFVPILEIDDFTRWTVDVPVLVGTSRSWFRVWMGPKFLYSHFSTALRLTVPGGDVQLASFEGHATYVGGQGGLAIGYRHLFFAVELTLAEAFGSAAVTATSLPEVRPFDFTGFIVYPSFGLIGEI